MPARSHVCHLPMHRQKRIEAFGGIMKDMFDIYSFFPIFLLIGYLSYKARRAQRLVRTDRTMPTHDEQRGHPRAVRGPSEGRSRAVRRTAGAPLAADPRHSDDRL